jgi:hypothetical protein
VVIGMAATAAGALAYSSAYLFLSRER